MALAGFAGLVVAVAAVVVLSGESLIGLVVAAVVCLLLGGAALWWAFTTRKVWKRWLNLVLVVLVVVTLVISLVVFSLWHAAGMLTIVVAALAYGLAARQALTGAAPAATVARAATPPARPWLLVNPRSGDGTAGRVGLVDGARVRGISVQELASGDDPATLAREAVAAGADAVGVAGGDGSLGLVAAVAVEFDVPFVCVPAGTRNHFAHDLGLDRADPLAALGAFSGQERRIDVAMVGDRMFLNNVSLGTYADMVAEPGYRARKLATAHSVLQAAVRGERARLAVEFTDPDGRLHEEYWCCWWPTTAISSSARRSWGAATGLTTGCCRCRPCGQGPERRWPGSSPRPPSAGPRRASPGRSGRPPCCGSTASFRSFLPGSTGRRWCCRRRSSSGFCRGPCACWSQKRCRHQRPERGH
jgi:hypothetical protein